MERHERGPENEEHRLPKVEARPMMWLQPMILVTLRKWNSYGYELMERLTELGFEATNSRTLYRTLRRMERNGGCPVASIHRIADKAGVLGDSLLCSLQQFQKWSI